MHAGRRAFVLAGAAGALSACGFQPLYRRTASGGPGSAQRELAGVFVELIPDRPGQLLREALQQRFQGGSEAAPGVYALHVDYSIAGEGIGVQPDNTTTRVRFIGRASFQLRTHDAAGTTLTTGTARTVDSENVIENQLFAADLETEAAQRRIAQVIADQVATQLAVFFKKRAASAA